MTCARTLNPSPSRGDAPDRVVIVDHSVNAACI